MTKLVVAVLVLVINLLIEPSHSQCNERYLIQPGTEAGSPLTCNVLGAPVQITCSVTGEGLRIGWLFTTDRNQAGTTNSTLQIATTNSRYIIVPRSVQSPTAIKSDLRIDVYDGSYDGYYWCEIVEFLNPPVGISSPSQVVLIKMVYTLDQLPKCISTLDFSVAGMSRCAFGDTTGSVDVIPGAEFLLPSEDNSTTPPMEATTPTSGNSDTTDDSVATTGGMTPRETESVTTGGVTPGTTGAVTPGTTPRITDGGGAPDATAVNTPRTTEEEITTTEMATESGNSSVVRITLIAFAAGAAVFILLAIGTVLCIVACCKS